MFYDKLLYKTEEVVRKNEIGQEVKELEVSSHFMGDIQPIARQGETVVSGIGEYIQSKYYLFTDETINVGDVLVYNNATYFVVDVIPCFDYTEAVIEKRPFNVKRWI